MGKSIISIEEAGKLLKDVVDRHPGNLKTPEGFLTHSKDSAEIMIELLDRVFFHYNEEFQFNLDKDEIIAASYLHDIGRPLQQDQLFHELRGARYIENNGVDMGVASTSKQLYRMAETLRSHFVVSEQFRMPELADKKADFEHLDPDLLLPITWNQAFLVYAELSNIGGKKVTFTERMDELKERYSSPNSGYRDPLFLKAFTAGEERIRRTCQRVEDLAEGKIPVEEIKRYGFLR